VKGCCRILVLGTSGRSSDCEGALRPAYCRGGDDIGPMRGSGGSFPAGKSCELDGDIFDIIWCLKEKSDGSRILDLKVLRDLGG
jgi:hypothetical protein